MIGFSEILSKESLGPIGTHDYRTYAEDIRLSGTHLLSLINDILDLSKIEANHFELHEEVFAVDQVWHEVGAILEESISVARLKLVDCIPDDLPLLRADPRAFRQIMLNLLSNAVKFTHEGGFVTIKALVDDEGRMVVNVTDTGIGIAAEDLETVLLPFKQVDSSLARKYEGTGLGLPLTQRLMQLHGGELQMESTPGVGTSVTLVFTADRLIARADAPPAAEPPRTAPARGPARAAQQEQTDPSAADAPQAPPGSGQKKVKKKRPPKEPKKAINS